MPLYSVQEISSGDVTEVNMKYADLMTFLAANPSHKQVFLKFPAMADSCRIGARKTDEGFKDVLRNVKSHHYKSAIDV